MYLNLLNINLFMNIMFLLIITLEYEPVIAMNTVPTSKLCK